MLGKLAAMMATALASAVVFIAHTGISPNSWFILYEPNIPEKLKGGDLM